MESTAPASLPRALTQSAPVLDYAWYPAASIQNAASFCFVASVRECPVKLLDASDGRVSNRTPTRGRPYSRPAHLLFPTRSFVRLTGSWIIVNAKLLLTAWRSIRTQIGAFFGFSLPPVRKPLLVTLDSIAALRMQSRSSTLISPGKGHGCAPRRQRRAETV